MKCIKLAMIFLASTVFFASVTHANEVRLTVNKPMNITYRLAYQDPGSEPVLSELQSIWVDKSVTIPVNLDNHMVAGMVPVSVDGHPLPDTANHFNQPNQCSMTTDAKIASGEIAFFMDGKKGTCKTNGGIFG